MKRYALVEFGKPLQEIESPDPVPTGTEVLIRVRRSGVCHSALHIADGFFLSLIHISEPTRPY